MSNNEPLWLKKKQEKEKQEESENVEKLQRDYLKRTGRKEMKP